MTRFLLLLLTMSLSAVGISAAYSNEDVPLRAISSEVEHYLDTVGVTGSIPVSPISLAGRGSL